MESNSSKYPKFNNWESDMQNGNRGAKGVMYMGIIAVAAISISLLISSYNILMFLFTFSMLLIVWIPIIYILLLPGVKGRILEIKENGLAVYNRNNELKGFHPWNTLVDMRQKHLRYGDITVLKFSDGARIKFFEETWILEVICEKCSHVTKEKYYEKSRDDKQRSLIFCIIAIAVGLLYCFLREYL